MDKYGLEEACRLAKRILRQEALKGEELIVNISCGRRPETIGVLLAAYTAPVEVSRHINNIIYITGEGEVIYLPVIRLRLGAKLRVLKALKDGPMSMKELREALGLKGGGIYRLVKDLMSMGLIYVNSKKVSLTSAGRIVIDEL